MNLPNYITLTRIFSVPVLGGEPRLILENAAGPVALPDGSLLLVRIDPENNLLLINGAIPGPNGGYVIIRQTNRLPVPQVKKED